MAAVIFVACAQALLLAQIRDYTLLGWDTYPQIASARVEGFADFVANFTEETADGVYRDSFYRPVFNLFAAADHAIWGIEPFGYHLTDALLTGLCAIGLFVLSRRLLGPGAVLGPWAALLTFVFLPVHIQIMPLPSRRMDILCGLFACLALATQVSRIHRRRPPGGVLPAFMTLLAVGSKEIGVIVAPLIFWMVLFVARSLPLRERLRVAAGIAISHIVAVAVVFAARFAALGKLGGHPETDLSAAFTGLPSTLGLILIELTSLQPFGAPPPPSQWLYGVGVAAILAFVIAAATLGLDRHEPKRGRGTQRPLSTAALGSAATAITWLLGIAAVQAATGFVRSWHLLMPGLAFGLLIGAAAHQLGQWFGHRRVPSALGLTILGAWIGLEASRSPLFLRYDHWEHASNVVEGYLDGLSRRIDASPDGIVILVLSPPLWVSVDPEHVSGGRVPGLHVYSLPSWVALRHPDRRVEFRHRRLANARAEPADGKLVVKLQNTGRFRGARSRSDTVDDR